MVLQLSCVTAMEERCRFIIQCVPPPEMAPGFAEVDRVLISRTNQMVEDARKLDGTLAVGFRRTFGEQGSLISATGWNGLARWRRRGRSRRPAPPTRPCC
jgi:hypothetical protein